jgi:multiple sugar transport system ATP-binding protein
MIYVTHDQVEAMTMADKIVVMHDGIIEQTGSPLDLYNKPANLFVAGFIGSPKMNFLECSSLPEEIKKLSPKGATTFGVRPEHLRIQDENILSLKVKTVEQLGSDSYLYGETIDKQEISIKLNSQTTIKGGDSVKVGFSQSDTHWFNEKGVSL